MKKTIEKIRNTEHSLAARAQHELNNKMELMEQSQEHHHTHHHGAHHEHHDE